MLTGAQRSGAGEPDRTVHLIGLPVPDGARVVTALCGILLDTGQFDAAEPGQGFPCPVCAEHAAIPAAPSVELPSGPHGAGPLIGLGEIVYRGLGWPVRIRGEQVVLPLGRSAAALIVPVDLAEAITPLLVARDCPAPALTHPDAPGCRVYLTGEPFGLPLPWPPAVRSISGVLPLSPSRTPHGPVRLFRQAPTHPLTRCREIDLFGAVGTVR